MFDKVLVPIELSEFDRSIMQLVSGLHRYGIEEAVIVHVGRLRGVERQVAVRKEKKFLADMRERASVIEKSGLKAKVLLLNGTPHEEILRTAEQEGVSLIISGTRGKGAFNELAVGSVSEMIGRKSEVPVLMVPYRTLTDMPETEAFKMGECIFDRIIYPTDFSDIAERTLDLLKSLNQNNIGEVVITHAVEPKDLKPENRDAFLRSTSRILSAIRAELAEQGITSSARLVVGPIVAELLQMADELGATCYVMASHGKGLGEELFIGSVSQNIIRMSNRPILITH